MSDRQWPPLWELFVQAKGNNIVLIIFGIDILMYVCVYMCVCVYTYLYYVLFIALDIQVGAGHFKWLACPAKLCWPLFTTCETFFHLVACASCYFISRGSRMIDMMRSQSWNPSDLVAVPDACNFPSIKIPPLWLPKNRLPRWLSHMSEAKGSEVLTDLLRGHHLKHNWYTVGCGIAMSYF